MSTTLVLVFAAVILTALIGLAIWAAIRAAFGFRARFIGTRLRAGEDIAIIQCGTCDTFTMAMVPAAVTPARTFMTRHYQENPDHTHGLDIIPKGWDQ